MKKKLTLTLGALVAAYALLALLRFVYLESRAANRADHVVGELSEGNGNDFMPLVAQQRRAPRETNRKNYATAAINIKGSTGFEQKYEKVGSITATSTQFDTDEATARRVVTEHRGLVQAESANAGDGIVRSLWLTIGVPPDAFDSTVASLKSVGAVRGVRITKTDKTNEFLQLRATRVSLEKSRAALNALRTTGGKMEELLKLESEVLDLDEKIHELDVQLGQFDKENEFCTIHFTLVEQQQIAAPSSRLPNLFAAAEWAGFALLVCLALLVLTLLCAGLILLVAAKVRTLSEEKTAGTRS